jgi:type IV secretion system protein VirB10
MSDHDNNTDRAARIEERRHRHGNRTGSNLVRKMGAVGIGAVATVVFPLVVFGPTNVGKFFGLINAEETQDASQFDLEVSGVSTQIPALEIETKAAEPKNDDADRLAALEALVKKLASRPDEKGVTAEDIKKLLAEQEAALRKQAEAERLLREAELKRLEEERKRKEELAKQAAELNATQTASKSIIVDGSNRGGGSGDSEDLRNNNQKFLDSAADGQYEIARSKPIGDTSRIIVQGTIISAVLETAINTELPGNIRAQVTEPVFSYDGEQILMPAGTRLVGTFNNDISTAQKRVLIAWNRAITPDGQSINIGSTGTDNLGRSGTAGNVDNRFMQRYGAAALISTITAVPSIITALAGGGRGASQSINPVTGAIVDAGAGAAQTMAQATSGILEERLSLPPIIRVPQGEDIRVFVNRDLVF